MKKLKMRSLKSVILFVIIFWIVAGVVGSSVLPAVKNLFVKPISWDDVDFDGDIEGLYITGTVYGIYDWYCEETLDNRTTGKEYLIDADDKYYMGLHATYSDMDDANALMEASQDYLNGYDDGSDLEDAQYEITGVITKMPDDSLQFYHEYLEWSSMDADERELFLPYYINVDKIGGSYDKVDTIIVSLIALAFFLIGLFMLIRVESPVMRVLVRILLLPVIAGVSYEVLKLAGRSDNFLVNLISKPGLAIQKLTTKEPDDSMIEVAIQAVEAVFDWRAYEAENFGTSENI